MSTEFRPFVVPTEYRRRYNSLVSRHGVDWILRRKFTINQGMKLRVFHLLVHQYELQVATVAGASPKALKKLRDEIGLEFHEFRSREHLIYARWYNRLSQHVDPDLWDRIPQSRRGGRVSDVEQWEEIWVVAQAWYEQRIQRRFEAIDKQRALFADGRRGRELTRLGTTACVILNPGEKSISVYVSEPRFTSVAVFEIDSIAQAYRFSRWFYSHLILGRDAAELCKLYTEQRDLRRSQSSINKSEPALVAVS